MTLVVGVDSSVADVFRKKVVLFFFLLALIWAHCLISTFLLASSAGVFVSVEWRRRFTSVRFIFFSNPSIDAGRLVLREDSGDFGANQSDIRRDFSMTQCGSVWACVCVCVC